jgi:histone H3
MQGFDVWFARTQVNVCRSDLMTRKVQTGRSRRNPKKPSEIVALREKREFERHCGPERKLKYDSGVVALREIRRYQKSTGLLIQFVFELLTFVSKPRRTRKAPFERLVREVTEQYKKEQRFAKAAIEALQEATEAYMVDVFADSIVCTIHAGRKTLMPDDLNLALRMRRDL